MGHEFTNAIKSWAIISIIAAHVYIDGNISLGLEYFKIFLNYFGTIGVGLFFIVSGYVWGNIGFNLKKSVSKLIIPWVISGSLIFLYVYVRKSDLDSDFFYSYLSFVLGQSSYLYYMSVYFIYILTARFWNVNLIGFIIFIVSLAYYIFKIPIFHTYFGVNEHLNPLLWFPYVYIGKYAKNILSFLELFRLETILIFSFIIFLMSYYYYEYNINSYIVYFSLFRVYLTFLFFLSLYYLYPHFQVMNKFNIVGEQSLFIYLWHMPLVGILNFIGNNYIEELHYFSVLIVLSFFVLLVLFFRTKKNSFYSFIGFRGNDE